ncbi:hypothetical protein Q3C01_18215 [Bradyrhizobium sp. UFLA05-109]
MLTARSLDFPGSLFQYWNLDKDDPPDYGEVKRARAEKQKQRHADLAVAEWVERTSAPLDRLIDYTRHCHHSGNMAA